MYGAVLEDWTFPVFDGALGLRQINPKGCRRLIFKITGARTRRGDVYVIIRFIGRLWNRFYRALWNRGRAEF
jgi:hypothetical protein